MAHAAPCRATQCPHPGCEEWAFLASLAEVIHHEAPIWRCGGGHRGPHVTGASSGPDPFEQDASR